MSHRVFLILMRLFLRNTTHTHYAPITPEWIQTKWNFFKKDCLLSVKSQTKKDFRLVVLVDKTFPHYELVRQEVEQFDAQGLYDLRYVDFPWGDGVPFSQVPFHIHIANFTKDYINRKYPACVWLTTSRLDGDDIIANDFVEKTLAVDRKSEGWIIWKNGYYFRGEEFVPHDTIHNAHLIYTEPYSKRIRTVYHRMHNRLAYQGEGDKRFTILETPTGMWADRVGDDTNIKKNGEYISTLKRFVHVDKVKLPIEAIRERFTFA